MIKLAYGEEPFLVDEKVNSWTTGLSVTNYDMRERSIAEVLEDCNTFSFFDDQKAIVLKDCYFLSSEKALKDEEQKLLEEYIKNPNDSTVLIFKVEKLDKRKKLSKTLIKAAETFEGKPMTHPHKWVMNKAKELGIGINQEVANHLVLNLGTSLYLLNSELTKIAIKYPNQSIQIPMLEGLLSRTLESDIFKLIDAIVNKKHNALSLLEDILITGGNAIQILLLIANKFRTMQQIKISEHTGQEYKPSMHPYAFRIAKEQAQMYSLEEINEKVQELAVLDLQMKRGEVEHVIALETLILKWL